MRNRLSPHSLVFPTCWAARPAPFSNGPESHTGVKDLFHGRLTVGKKLYVGNLTYAVNDSDLEQLFSQFGTVQTAR